MGYNDDRKKETGKMTGLRIMTLNMLTDSLYSYGDSRFSVRIKAIEEMIRVNAPDVIGLQELTDRMLPLMTGILADYALTGESRGSRINNEYSAILYRRDRFSLLKEQTYWLSRTPLKKGSRMFGSQFPRICSCAVLKDGSTEETFTVFNTHLDLNFPRVRHQQAMVLRDLIRSGQSGSFTAVTGDFNDVTGSLTLRLVCEAGLIDTSDPVLGSTLRGRIGSWLHKNRPIDHILLSRHISDYKITKIDTPFKGYWPSDHYPLLADLTY